MPTLKTPQQAAGNVSPFKFGLGAGLAWSLWGAVEMLFGFHSTHLAAGEYGEWMNPVIQFVMLVLLLGAVHRQRPLGRLEPWDAALRSLGASVVFAALIFIGTVAFVNYIDPGWLTHKLTWKVARMRAAGITEEDIRSYIVATREAYTGLGLARSCFVILPLVGGMMGVLICFFLNWRWEKAHLASP